jgi:2-polyprenyl-3-methyl-5-hydroxy-6-metoxy-1,4-benzoquinol methylase
MEMNEKESIQILAEISRLNVLGWKDWKRNDLGLKTMKVIDETKISFPRQAHSLEQINSESKGIWARIRALEENNINLIWEVGAGGGLVAIHLKKAGFTVIAIEPLENGARSLQNAGFTTYLGTLEDLSLPESSIGCIGVFDVLEHLEYPEQLLSEIKRILRPGGILLTTVPANQWLFSDYDLSIGHFRRYSRQTLNSMLEKIGFENNQCSYFFFSLVLPAYILRVIPFKLGRRRKYLNTNYSNQKINKIIQLFEVALSVIFKIEDKFRLPTGLSIISKSNKPMNYK